MHIAYICKIKERNLPKLSVYGIWRKSLRTQECVRLIHGKQAIGVRAIEVLLYLDFLNVIFLHFSLCCWPDHNICCLGTDENWPTSTAVPCAMHSWYNVSDWFKEKGGKETLERCTSGEDKLFMIFMILCVLCFKRQSFFTFIFI